MSTEQARGWLHRKTGPGLASDDFDELDELDELDDTIDMVETELGIPFRRRKSDMAWPGVTGLTVAATVLPLCMMEDRYCVCVIQGDELLSWKIPRGKLH